MRSIERRDKAVEYHRETLLTLRADMRNIKAVAQSLDSESALRKPELIGKLYRSLDNKLRGKLEAFLPPDQWSFKTFIQFLNREIAYIDAVHVIKIGPEVLPVTKTRSTSQWNPSSRRQTKDQPQMAFSGKFEKNGAKRLHSKQCVLHPKALQYSLTECRKFQSLKVAERWNVVKDHGLCFNCFAVNYYTRNCRLTSCSKCDRDLITSYFTMIVLTVQICLRMRQYHKHHHKASPGVIRRLSANFKTRTTGTNKFALCFSLLSNTIRGTNL